jgi:hypothetical protein
MNVIAAILFLVQMQVCLPVTVPAQGGVVHAIVCPIPKDFHDALVEATTDPA